MNHGTNRKLSRISDKKVIKDLFTSVLPFTSINCSIEDNWLWICYNSCKLPVKSNTTSELTTHQRKVAEVLNTISTSPPTLLPEEHYE